jgi:hypothetical protein
MNMDRFSQGLPDMQDRTPKAEVEREYDGDDFDINFVSRENHNAAIKRIMQLERENKELRFENNILQMANREHYEPTAQERAKRMGIYCD